MSERRPWAIARRSLAISLTIACLAEAIFLITILVACFRGNMNWGLIVVVAAWPPYYGMVFGVCWGMATIDQNGPYSGQIFPQIQNLFPLPFRRMADAFYPKTAGLGLLIFPVLALLVSFAILLATATEHINR